MKAEVTWLLAITLAIGLGSAAVAEQSLSPPGALACSGCHGAERSGAMPSLVGQSAEQIEAAMLGFKSGERPATLMNRIAKGFSDDETRAIAQWLAAPR